MDVHLRPLTPEDSDDILQIYDERTNEFLPMPPIDPTMCKVYLENCQRWDSETPPTRYERGIVAAGELVGVVKVLRTENGWETAYCVRQDRWGRGYATEAVRKVVRMCWDYGLPSLEARVDAKNVASHRVLEKNGFDLVSYSPEGSVYRRRVRS